MTASSREVLDLAEAIREALSVPVADRGVDGAKLDEQILRLERAAIVRGALSSLTEGVGTISSATAVIREGTADTPVTYAVYQDAEVAS